MGDIGQGEDDNGRLWRWVIDTKTGKVSEEQLDEAACDFPRIDERHMGLPARYGYAMALDTEAPTLTFDRYLYKYDFETGRRQTHDLGEGWHGGEPCFAPRSADAAEDDGWVLSIDYDRNADESWLVIVNARDFEAAPAARVKLPRRVPFGAHGNWLAD